MIRTIFSKIPGFRSGMIWKKIVASIIYIISILIILVILTDGNKFTTSSQDNSVKQAQNYWIVVVIFIIPFLLVANSKGLLTRLPLFRSNRAWVKLIASLLTIPILLIVLGLGYNQIDQLYSPEYKANRTAYKAKQEEIAAKKATLAANQEEEKRKSEAQKKQQQAAQKAEEKAKKDLEKERQEQEALVLAAKQEAEKRKEEEQRKLQATAQNKQKQSEPEPPEENKQAVIPVSETPNHTEDAQTEPVTLMEGFRLIQADGFAIQVPDEWHSVNSNFTKSYEQRFSTKLDIDDTPIGETYDINFKTDMQFYSKIEIIRYDKSQDYEKFAKTNGYGAFQDNFQKIEIKNADAAFEWKDYKDSIGQKSSRELVVFKNDVCYIFYSYHEINHTEGSWANIYRQEIKKFRADLEKIYDSFQIVYEGITFEDVIQNEYKL